MAASLLLPLTAGAHTVPAHCHSYSHGITGDGFGWYHSTTRYSVPDSNGYYRNWHKHYTYLAAKHAYVFQHSSNSYCLW